MIALLTAPETLAVPSSIYRFMTELASIETVLDSQGVPVPAYFKKVDVCVAEPCVNAITTKLAAKGHLDDYQIVSHWISEDCDCF